MRTYLNHETMTTYTLIAFISIPLLFIQGLLHVSCQLSDVCLVSENILFEVFDLFPFPVHMLDPAISDFTHLPPAGAAAPLT